MGFITARFVEINGNLMKKKKGTWGGKRVSTKPKKEPTKTIRVPESLVDEFKNIIKHHPKDWHYVLKDR
jgi:hypothetical protein